jgi:DNA-binding MarR family transcriptional regulator
MASAYQGGPTDMLDSKQGLTQAGKRRRKASNGRTDTIDRSVIHLLHRASQRASEIFAWETRDFALTARQYAVIASVAQFEGLSQTDLVKLTGIDRSTLADVVQRLLKRGLIARQRTIEDGRTYAVHLSYEGRKLLEAIRPFARRADRTVLACLGEENGREAVDILGRLLRKSEREERSASSDMKGRL